MSFAYFFRENSSATRLQKCNEQIEPHNDEVFHNRDDSKSDVQKQINLWNLNEYPELRKAHETRPIDAA